MDERDNGSANETWAEFELDLLPEYCQYRDEGCKLAGSCLHCPFPHCAHEKRGGGRRWLKKLRGVEMVRMSGKGKNVKQIAARFGVSRRTAQRALKAVGDSALSATRSGSKSVRFPPEN